MSSIVKFAPESRVSVSDAIEQAVPWEARKVPMYIHNGVDGEVTSHRAVVRSDTLAQIGVVGKDYTVVQAAQAFAPVQALVDAGVARITRAGEYEGGRTVFIEAELPTERPIEVAKGDVMRQTITFTNSHNGGSSLRATYQLLRLVCLNGMTRPEMSTLFRASHRPGVHVALERAKVEIAQRFHAVETEVELFRRLLGKRLSDKNLVRYVRETLSEGAGNDPAIKVRNVDRIVELAHTAPGATPGTLYGGLNALTYWATHERGRTPDARAMGLLFGQSGALLQRATDVAVRYAEKLPDVQYAVPMMVQREQGFEAMQSVATASAELTLLLGKPSAIV